MSRAAPERIAIAMAEGSQAPASLEECLQRVLMAMERPFVPPDARRRLLRLLKWQGEEHVILVVRTITESEGNEGALVEPIISAVCEVMWRRPDWPERGLAWIEAFDQIDLLGLLKQFDDLSALSPSTIARAYPYGLFNRLYRVLEPAVSAAPKHASHPAGKPGYLYKRGPRQSTIDRYERRKLEAEAKIATFTGGRP